MILQQPHSQILGNLLGGGENAQRFHPGKLSDRRHGSRGIFCWCGWDKEVPLICGTFDIPPLKPSHRYRLAVGGFSGRHPVGWNSPLIVMKKAVGDSLRQRD